MGVFLYNLFLFLFKLGVRVSAPFSPKAKKWINGRKSIFEKLEAACGSGGEIIWMHCASLGEFEQGRPVLEKLREDFPRYRVLLTFFSPSGYEVQKNYKGADLVFYLPADGPRNARRFLEIVKPALVIFVKYEFWYYYLKKIKHRRIPLLLVSAIFRKDSAFFRWYGGIYRKMLSRFDHVFLQDDNSRGLLERIGLGERCSVSGDTRFDRVIEVAENFSGLPHIAEFIGGHTCIVAGSTWKEDEMALRFAIDQLGEDVKLILAPHEIDKGHIGEIRLLFPGCLLYSQVEAGSADLQNRVLVIDNIGMLSRLYRYATIAYVGGGLNKGGVHNVLEAAVFGKPVIMGSVHEKYKEAVELVAEGGASVIQNEQDLLSAIKRLIVNENGAREDAADAARNYVWRNKGASGKIVRFIQENRLLTI